MLYHSFTSLIKDQDKVKKLIIILRINKAFFMSSQAIHMENWFYKCRCICEYLQIHKKTTHFNCDVMCILRTSKN